MKAMIWTKYGSPDGLQLREIEKPVPRENEVLVKILATTVTTADCELRSLKFPFVQRLILRLYVGLKKPRINILGQELAGEIETVGEEVTQFRKGDPIFAWTGFRLRTNAEYTCLPANGVLAIKPTNISYEEAAPLAVGGLEAVHFLRRGDIQNGQKVLINGAGGSIGTFAIQLAKHYGAEVTGVDSTEKLDMLRTLGAEKVIDYTQQDFTRNGETYDVIFDVVGKSSFADCVRVLRQNGRYMLGNPHTSQRVQGNWTRMRNSQKVIFRMAHQTAGDLDFLKELIEAGKMKTIIDRLYPLEQLAEAHRYVESGRKKGNVVITVEHIS